MKGSSQTEESLGEEKRAKVGETIGGLIGSATGMPFLPIVGSGIGSLVGSKVGRAEVSQLFQGVKLKDDEIQFCLNVGQLLTDATVAAINELATEHKTCVLTVDVYEQATPTIDEWIRTQLLSNLETSVVVVIAGRIALQRLYGWNQFISITRQIELVSFTETEDAQFWRLYGLEDKVKIQTLREVTKGHPFINGLLADVRRSQDASFAEDLDYLLSIQESSLIIEQLLKRFTTEFQDTGFGHLVRACAVPRWFDRGLLEATIGPEARDLFDRIAGLSFVVKNRDGSFSLHELARDALLADARALDPGWVNEIHGRVAEQLATRRKEREPAGVQYISNELYHRLSANESEGLSFGADMLRSLKSLGAQASLDSLVSEIAEFPFSSREGQMWRMYCSSQDSLRRGDWDTASQFLDELLHQPDIAAALRLWVTESRATILIGRGEYRKALALQEDVTQQLSVADHHASYSELTEAYYRLIETCGILSRFHDADIYLTQAVNMVGVYPISKARLLLAQASCHRLHGLIDDGLQSASEAVSIYRAASDPRPVAFALIQLSRLMTHNGSWIEAEERLQEAATLEASAPYEYDVGNIYLFRGNIYRRRRSWAQALECYERALGIHQRIGSLREIGPLYGNLGVVHYALGNRSLAKKYLDDSLRLKEEQDYLRGVGFTLKYIGDASLIEGNYDLAKSQYERAKLYADQLDIRYLRPWVREGLVRAYLRAGGFQASKEILTEPALHETEFPDLSSTALLYGLLVSHLLNDNESDAIQTASVAIHAAVTYNPYSLYRTLDLIALDSAELIEKGIAQNASLRDYWKILHSTCEEDSLKSSEMRERQRERIPTEVPGLAHKMTELINRYGNGN